MIDEGFMAAVSELSVPEMGTDAVAPLLYWLVRSTRPRRVLEVGMGYTTPFLAKALDDNVRAVERERSLLGDPGSVRLQPLADEDYYDQEYAPRLFCIDRMTDPASSAPRVVEVLRRTELDHRCQIVEDDLRGSADRLRDALGTVDLAWIDTWDTLAFVREYWDLIDPAGGVLAVHYLMTYPQGRAVLEYLSSLAGPDGGRLEMINLREPHRFAQNSLTLIRRVRDYVDPADQRLQGFRQDPTGVLDVSQAPGRPASDSPGVARPASAGAARP